ncbi:Nitrogen regulatory protein PII [Eubacterium aggregans]|uniref:Nitrogen regulatory protein PII n=1 Tax=Eubacterium aggregans TaxID=81409 RepID=A0A1H4EJQ0_9FIRM|nr:P-II family nitrogen regulator [Eubacterium aggregans]SEA85079.1 Nitrogen regulatory protein PII [Eubacterium aggregans]
MINYDNIPIFELIYVIVNYGSGSRVLHKAKEYGISGGTVFLGRGTVNNSLLKFFSLYDEKKEIVLMGTDKHTADRALVELNKDFQFEKPNHGIVFTTSTCEIVGSRCCICEQKEERGVNEPMYQFIITIVNRGKAEEVIEAAKAAGSKGGTIINARGSGVHETSKLFNMDIEPEKEIVMILTKEDITEAVVSSIRERLDIDKAGNGIIFIQNVNKTYGIYE